MKAKVTVHFGNVGVVVPCYDCMTVNDLIKASILRYKKATGKAIYNWQCTMIAVLTLISTKSLLWPYE
ncbi:hypothetical protein X798_01430 [Onchocerca flexuosa]|uniref:Par3/HAL N-terminal domain-containing protein n=1 Tax=Onchocerca flexuosa TaxID=387005 RepID=A0A238C3C7_9BILA|nr:hypothetical protein X798_01430 [Onchocerca flexuosa]